MDMDKKSYRRGSDTAFDIINFFVITVFLLAVLYPCVYVVSASFSDAEQVAAGNVKLFPKGFTLKGYQTVFMYQKVWVGFKNSVIYAGLGVSLTLFLVTLAAYPLSRKTLMSRGVILKLFVFTMYFSGGLIPTYQIVRAVLGVDNIAVMVVPGAMSVFYTILMRTYFQNSIPDTLHEAAQIDGCNDYRFLVTVVIPLSKPIIAIIALYTMVNIWNNYFSAFLYLTSPGKQPLQIVLRNILVLNQVDPQSLRVGLGSRDPNALLNLQELMKYSLIIIASAPLLIAYPFVQKFFVRGILIGSIKG